MKQKQTLVFLALFTCLAFFQSLNAQGLTDRKYPPAHVSNCDLICPTFGLQINAVSDGACGYVFNYQGLLGCDVVGASWTIGLGNLGGPSYYTGNYVYHEFLLAGTYTVSVVLTLFDGTDYCYKTISRTITIAENCPGLVCGENSACKPWSEGEIYMVWGPSGSCTFVMGLKDYYSPCSNQKFEYNWGDGTIDVSTSDEWYHVYPRNGDYRICITVTAINDMGTDSCQWEVCRYVSISNCTTNKTEEIAIPNAEVEVYPNPVSGGNALTVDWAGNLPAKQLALFDVNGREVTRWAIEEDAASSTLQVPENMSPGIYFLKSEHPSLFMHKVVVQ